MKYFILLISALGIMTINVKESNAQAPQKERSEQISVAASLTRPNQPFYSLSPHESSVIPSQSRIVQTTYNLDYFDIARRSKIKGKPQSPQHGKTGPTYRDDVGGKRELPNYKGHTKTTTNSLPSEYDRHGMPSSKKR